MQDHIVENKYTGPFQLRVHSSGMSHSSSQVYALKLVHAFDIALNWYRIFVINTHSQTCVIIKYRTQAWIYTKTAVL